ncbi:DUF4834 family protein [Hymenobacter sp. H14-R3]|uniref:DUF4834 family protein n=1 Tax=Hymenobacter sp. H14-R3 TaxID=3046308 RepID=UPI0024BB8AC5|nr:DUF4834 family protein [Hymenobacter sp. H14-R3]MDJ0363607.1 DUF4834 family protein [Hymenobacter sp. H14-R3]
MAITLSLLLVFLLVRYVLPQVLRAVLGNFVRQQVHKAQQGGFYPPNAQQPGGYTTQGQGQGQRQGQGYQQDHREPATKPGQVRVEYVPPTTSASERKHEFRGGEYVDYEELP